MRVSGGGGHDDDDDGSWSWQNSGDPSALGEAGRDIGVSL